MQKIDPDKLEEFFKKTRDLSKFICWKCKHKSKKKSACGINDVDYLDYENNTCSKFEAKDDE